MRYESENTEFKSRMFACIFEEMRTMEQELSFDEAANAFRRYNVAFTEDKYIALGIRNMQDGQYTNLAQILSDSCRHTIKVAVFADKENTVFKDAKEFGGSVFRQLDESYAYLNLCNRTFATFDGLERVEQQDYPNEALREALLNAIIHRDYSYSGSIIINVNDSCIEFISLGGLLPGLSADDICSGISQPRNRKLAEVFHRLKLIESYGTGIRRIYALYKNCSVQPRIDVTSNTFKMTLPNMNRQPANGGEKVKESIAEYVYITPQMQKVLEHINTYGQINDEELQNLLNVKRTRAYLIAREMTEKGLIASLGRGNEKKYIIRNR